MGMLIDLLFSMAVTMAMSVAVAMPVRVSVAVIMSMIVVVGNGRMKHVHHDDVEDEAENGCDEHKLAINLVLNENPLECLHDKPNS